MKLFKKMAVAVLLLAIPGMSYAGKYTASNVYGKPWLVISIQDPADSYAAYNQSPLPARVNALLQLPMLKENVDFQKVLLEKEKAEVQLGYKLDLKTFCSMLGGADLAMYTAEDGEGGVLLALKIADKEKFARLLSELEKSKDAEISVNSTSYKDKNIKVATKGAAAPEIAWVMFSDELFLCGTLDQVKYYIDMSASSQAATIESTPEFQKSVSGLPAVKFHSFGYMDYSSLSKAIMSISGSAGAVDSSLMQQMQEQYGELYISFGKVAKADHVELYSFVPTPPSGILADTMSQFKPGRIRAVEYLPAPNFMAIWQNTFDGEMIWKTIMDTINGVNASMAAQLGANNPVQQMEQQIAMFEAVLGFNIKNDLLMGIGPELFFNIGSINGTLIDLTIGFQIRDATKVNKVVTGLTNVIKQYMNAAMGADPSQPAPNPIITQEFQGVQINSITHPGLAMFGYAPGFYTDGKYLVIGSSIKSLQDSIRSSKGQMSNIQSQESYRKVFSFIGTEGNQISVADIRSTVQSIETLVMSFMAASWQDSERQAFTTVTALLKTLTVMGSNSSSNDKGTLNRAIIFFE